MPPRRSATRLLLFFLLAGAVLQTHPEAKEARKWGRNATIVWVDENGARQETRGGEIRYGYFTRAQLSVPRNGKSYRDDEHQVKGLTFGGRFLRFTRMRRIDFEYRKVEETGGTRLVITITPLRGKPFTESGNTLSGSDHPASPFIAFMVDGAQRRMELLPLATDQDRSGRPRIVSADFKI